MDVVVLYESESRALGVSTVPEDPDVICADMG